MHFMTYKKRFNEPNDTLILSFRLHGEWACFKNHPLPVYQKSSGQYKFPLEERASFEPISKRSRYATQAILFVELRAMLMNNDI